MEINMDSLQLMKILHDLKQPIDNISGVISVIKSMTDDPRILRFYNIIEECCSYSRGIVSNAYELAKIQEEAPRPYYSSRSVNDYIKYYVEHISAYFISRDIDFEYSVRVNEDSFICDYEMLSRILNNIMGNASKYVDKEHKKVKLTVTQKQDNYIFEIEDNGMGIPKKELPHVTECSYRGTNAILKVADGSGLGLNLVKEYTAILGAELDIKSKLNEGTTVTVTVPSGKVTTFESSFPEINAMEKSVLDYIFCTPGYM